jgi:hypothetical protein
MVHPLPRRLLRHVVGLHDVEPALRQELEEGPRNHGRQGRHAGPTLQGHAPGRGTLARHSLQRWPDALPRQHGVEDEPRHPPRQPHRRGPQWLIPLHGRRRPGREQHPPLAHRKRLARSNRRPPPEPLLQHRLATYIWVLTNRKPDHRKGQVQLIDATQWFKPLRKNLGKKNCELAPEDIQRICDTYLAFQETPQSKIFPNAAFGYWKVTVERPLRLHSQLSVKAIEGLRFASGDEDLRVPLYDEFGDKLVENFPSIAETLEKRLADWSEASDSPDPSDSSDDPPKKTLPERTKRRLLDPTTWERDARLVEAATALRKELGGDLFGDYNIFRDRVDAAVKKLDLDLTAPDLKLILRVVSWRVETAPPVIAKQQKLKPGEKVMDEEKLHGWADLRTPKSAFRIQFEPDPDLRDTEQVPLLEPGGIEAFIRREVLPYMRLISVCATWG